VSLLLDALRKAQDARDRGRGIEAHAPSSAPAPAPAPRARRPASPLLAAVLAIAIFAGAVSAWHSQPWRPPARTLIDPSQLKLDTHLDPARKGTPPPPATGTPPS
jgi:ferric-dicitrate binding protein FerR (iron transport regulator)